MSRSEFRPLLILFQNHPALNYQTMGEPERSGARRSQLKRNNYTFINTAQPGQGLQQPWRSKLKYHRPTGFRTEIQIMKNSIKKRLRIYYMPMLALSFIFCIVFYIFRKPALDIIPFITITTGYLSILLLAVSLLLGPINLILKHKNPVSTHIRRDIGIYGGILGVIHSMVGLFVHFTGRPWLYFVKEIGDGFGIRGGYFGLANYTGLLGVLIIIFLLIISNDYFFVRLKTSRWKRLQRLTYLMFILVLAHAILYRINANKEELIMFLYIPMLLMVVLFQLIGVWFATRKSV
jgi:sulfoxide reductase heme-binding subunit YedZ